MVRRRLALLACLLVAGCAGAPAGPSTTDDAPEFGTQFVTVRPVDNGTDPNDWPADERTTYENLTDAQQRVFRDALEDGRQTFDRDETNPFDFNDDDRPQLVRYRGEWYHVGVVIV